MNLVEDFQFKGPILDHIKRHVRIVEDHVVFLCGIKSEEIPHNDRCLLWVNLFLLQCLSREKQTLIIDTHTSNILKYLLSEFGCGGR
jgi:hypothetical protein